MVERDKTIEIWWFQRPKLYHLALFLPCSKNCQGHIDGYNENYLFDEEFLQKKKVSSWEDIPIAYGFKTWENMSEEKNVYLDRSLKKIATKLLEGLEK
jgi:hypothetical protein